MAAKPRKSVVQNIIKNLLEMEIPEIQTASKELAEWIKQLEQHSFKLQHYATEIENWASEEEEVDSIELTDLIKDLEATLSDMRQARIPAVSDVEQDTEVKGNVANRLLRSYGRSGRSLPEPKALPKAEVKEGKEKLQTRYIEPTRATEEEIKGDAPRTAHGVLIARDSNKIRVKTEFPSDDEDDRQVVTREDTKGSGQEERDQSGYMTPEGFLIRKKRPY